MSAGGFDRSAAPPPATPQPTSLFSETLAQLLSGREFAPGFIQRAMCEIVGGRWGDIEIAAFLVALRMRGETAMEIAEAATVVRQAMRVLDVGPLQVLDTCGTGGDGAGIFNVSTAVAFVVAAAGVPVVKHGNRAVSGHTAGSADVMAELGVRVEGGPERARHCLQQCGLAFCYAPDFHPALRQVGAVRRRLPTRTLFNLLGPLTNPARAPYQLIGVGQPEWLDRLAGAVKILDARRAFIVSGREALDEVSLSGPTLVREVRGDELLAHEWTAADFGLDPCNLADLKVSSAAESAARIGAVLAGDKGSATRMVLANAAAALLAAERVANLSEGVRVAADALESGRARRVLEHLIGASHEPIG
jgi:anthranilate phosphoribosyltransferase